MAVGDIYELKAYQDFGSRTREVLNIYYVRQSGIEGDSAALRRAYLDEVDPLIRAWQSLVLKTTFVETRNLFSVSDFDAIDVSADSLVGAVNASSLPVHDSITFRLIRTSRDINNGYKRYAGCPETAVDNGYISDTGTLTLLEDLRLKLIGTWVDPDNEDATFQQVILKRVRHEPDEDHENVWYTLPTTVEEAVYSDPASALLNQYITTQNSRKPR